MKRCPERRASSRAPRGLPRSVFALLTTAIGALALGVGHEGESSADVIPECVEYMHAQARCFGGSDPIAPVRAASADRERLRRSCIDDKQRLDRACR